MSFSDVLREAVADFAERGYESEAQLQDWVSRIRSAAEADLVPEDRVEEEVRRVLGTVYDRLIERGGIFQRHPDVGRFTVERLRPAARAELQRAIFASAGLIRLNRTRAVEETVQRFAGWATSVPRGGSENVRRRDVQVGTRRELQKLAYEARRVGVDQGHKFAASLDRILADESGAIAGQWHHHYVRYPRPEHVARDRRWYVIRDGWAYRDGLIRPIDGNGFLEDHDQAGEKILCRCSVLYRTELGRVPTEMLTGKGRRMLESARQRVA